MIKEHKEKWVAALRSGKYTQAQEVLKCDTGFCCLGVLLDTYDPEGWEQSPEDSFLRHKGNKYGERDDYEEGDEFFDEVSEDAELTKESLEIFGLTNGQQFDLIGMNDSRGSTFEEIADWIEEKL